MYGSDTTFGATALPLTGAAVFSTLIFGLVCVFASVALLTILAVGNKRRCTYINNAIANREAVAKELQQP